MFTSIRVIAGGFRNIGLTVVLNIIYLVLKGSPFGILFLVINELLKPKNEIRISMLAWMFASMALIMTVNLFLAIKVHVRAYITSYSLATKARLRLGDHLRKLSLGFFKKRDPGDISALLLQDMYKVENIFSHFFIDAVSSVIIPLLMAFFFMIADWRMTALMTAFAAIAIPVLVAGHKIIAFFGQSHVETRNQVASRMLEYLQGIKVLMAFNLTGKNFSRLDSIMKKFCRDSIKLEAAAAGPVLLYSLILEYGFIGILVFGTFFLSHGEITLPVFLMFLVIGYNFFEPLISFGIFMSEMKYMNIAAGRIAEVMDTMPLKEPDIPGYPSNYNIEFVNTCFGYTGKKVLDNINAIFMEKSITALVGLSGSGKTTLTSLVARFWDVNEGSIRIGGTDIRDIPCETLNSLISIVFQDVYLFQDTIFNNIRVGKKDATMEEVINAAKKAGCHDFIMEMENGYDTMAGEGGARLSGGEKQRISIARALLKDAPIVLLDEATASLDPENELVVQKAIGEMIRSRTLVVIAHRLKTIANADQILVLDKGRIVEQGRHEQLLKNGMLYSRLWNEQQKAGGWKFKGKADDKPDGSGNAVFYASGQKLSVKNAS